MKQLQFYKYATWILLILNLAIVTFFFVNRPPGPPGGDPRPLKAIDVLGLDEEQHRLFLASVEAHEERLNALNEKQRVELLPYFQSVLTDADTTNYDAALNRIQAIEGAKIKSLFQHLRDIKSLLKADQQDDFKIFVENIMERNLFKTKKNPPPPPRDSSF